MGFVRVGRLAAFREGRGRVVLVDGVRVAVFRFGGRAYALRDACPHMGLSLAEGALREGRVQCPGHAWSFDLRTGASDRRSKACAAVYETRIEDGELLLRAPAAPAPAAEPGEPWVAWDDRAHLKRERGAPSEGAAHGEEGPGQADGEPDAE